MKKGDYISPTIMNIPKKVRHITIAPISESNLSFILTPPILGEFTPLFDVIISQIINYVN